MFRRQSEKSVAKYECDGIRFFGYRKTATIFLQISEKVKKDRFDADLENRVDQLFGRRDGRRKIAVWRTNVH